MFSVYLLVGVMVFGVKVFLTVMFFLYPGKIPDFADLMCWSAKKIN